MSTQTTLHTKTQNGLSQGFVLLTFLLGIFMGALDHGIIGPALSSIFAAFQVDASWGVWSFTIYTLTFAISIPVLGKLSDRFGRKQTFMSGITLFALGSLVAAFAPNFGLFLAGRAIQAIGAGGIFPITAAHIAATTAPENRGKALGLIGVAFGLGSILGPTIGGLILASFEWQWVFLINIPISVIILLMMSGYKQQQAIMKRPIDYPGILLLSMAIMAFMYGITSHNILALIAGVILVPLLILVEKKQADPVMNVGYFTRGNTLTLLLASAISGFVMATSVNFLPLFAETVLQVEKGGSGFIVTPFAIASMLASLAGGALVDKIGAKKVLVAGFLTAILGAVSLAFLVMTLPLFLIVTVVMGFGVGIIIGAPLNVLILQAVGLKEMGAAVGYLSLFRSLGSTIGPAIAGTLLAQYTNGFTTLYIVSTMASLVAIILLFLFVKAAGKQPQA